MIVYFPEIYPDELVYSWFCRYYVHAGCMTHKDAMQELYCNRSDTPSKEFIGNLNPTAREKITRLLPMRELIFRHTMFPQYARFMPLHQKKRALMELEAGTCNVKHMFSMQPKTGDEQFMRYCPKCAEEDRAIYGETYWHRRHQMHNVSVCLKHNCMLEGTSVPSKSEHSYTFCPAENAIPLNTKPREVHPLTLVFNECTVSVFDAPIKLQRDVPISAILYHGMKETRYMRTSGKARNTKMLAEDMQDFYKDAGLNEIASMNQVQRVLIGSRFDSSVICQIAYFVGLPIEDIISPKLTDAQIQEEAEIHSGKNLAQNWEELDRETEPKLSAVVRGIYDGTLNENGRPERVSERIVYQQMGLKAHQLENMPLCRQVLMQYKESYPESWARKIVWAYRKLADTGVPIYWSDIREISGVKKKNLGNVVPFLGKYASKKELGKIWEICGIED